MKRTFHAPEKLKTTEPSGIVFINRHNCSFNNKTLMNRMCIMDNTFTLQIKGDKLKVHILFTFSNHS